jgi:sulfatase maturation enzyme AslB (radical SAM superfamily)
MVRKHDTLKKYLYLQPHQKKINVDVLKGSFKNAEFVTFAGGEPVIDDDTILVIKMMKNESSKLKLINFSTNLTNVNDELFKELHSIDAKVLFSLSIDGPPHIHNYIRYHCEWDTMMKNLEYMIKTYPKFDYSVNTTVSSLNVGYVTDTLDTIESIKKRFGIHLYTFMTSPVVDKPFLHPSLLPEEVKAEYIKKINNYVKTLDTPNSDMLIPTAIEMLNGKVDSSLDTFVGYINEFDRIAGTKATDVYPEFKSFM